MNPYYIPIVIHQKLLGLMVIKSSIRFYSLLPVIKHEYG